MIPVELENQLVDYVFSVDFDDLTADVVDLCKLFIMDSLGTAIAGSESPGCREVVNLVKSWGGAPMSTVMVYGGKVAPPFAALANSTMMHALDFDDTLDASALHTFVTVLPAALSVGEQHAGTNGKSLITALVLGVDLICRISYGIRRPLSWIRTSTCGSFGAAGAVAKLLGLDKEGIHNALGIAYSQTAGNAQGLIEGRLVKRMQPAFASQAGVLAGFLAQCGITGSREFLLGKYGFFHLYEQGEVDPHAVLADLGRHYCIRDLSIKPYPSCRMTHASIDAARKAIKQIGARGRDVEEIRVRVSKMVFDLVGKPFALGANPQVDAQFSLPYTVAAAVLHGDVSLKDFEEGALRDRQVKKLAEKVKVDVDTDLPEKDILHSRVSIRMKGQGHYESGVDSPLGNPSNRMNWEDCREKFRKCLHHRHLDPGEKKFQELFILIENLEHVQDVGKLLTCVEG